jgi:Cdc6-like AAA superfamily ATPase
MATTYSKTSTNATRHNDHLPKTSEAIRGEFKRFQIAHPRIARVLTKLSKMILADSGFDIVLVIGPTGVGKTSVLNALYKRINQQYESERKNNPGFIPCIKFEVPEPGPRQFAWSTFYMEPLAQLNDPLIGRKVEVICDGGVTKVKPNTSKALNP